MGDMLVSAVEELDEKETLVQAKSLLRRGKRWMDILELLQEGMRRVGQRYESGEYFIADLILSGVIFNNVIDLEEMHPDHVDDSAVCGTILVGTVEGDIHDIGKNILASLLMAQGFHVIDLGTDVPPMQFIEQARIHAPQVIALSGIMTFSALSMKTTISELRKAGLRDRIKVMVGGSCVTEEIARDIGADGFSKDCIHGLGLCKAWLQQSKK